MAGERFDRDSKFANIHGMVSSNGLTTCRTREGNMCTGCCTALDIVDQFNKNKTLKEEGVNCPVQIFSEGCQHLFVGRPQDRFQVCTPYHCGGDRRILISPNPNNTYNVRIAASHRLTLENIACFQNREIDQRTYNENLERIPTP